MKIPPPLTPVTAELILKERWTYGLTGLKKLIPDVRDVSEGAES